MQMRNHDLASSLDEFGLSAYEAKAYLTLLERGSLSASELAYHSNLPRTKVYSTLARLSKKGLIVITQHKPLVCSAVPPDDAFGGLLAEQENKINDMKSAIARLEKISEESNKINGVQEQRFLMLAPSSVLVTLNELILGAKEEIACATDSWGLRILSQCKNAMIKSIADKKHVKILVSKNCMDNDVLPSVPDGASVKIGHFTYTLFMFDRSTIVIVDSNNGKGAMFRATDFLTNLHGRIFDMAWVNGTDASFLMSVSKELGK
jgi:sugar-specific transcriptional regulator TrmB